MRKLILSSAIGAFALALSACDNRADEAAEADAATAEADAAAAGDSATAAAADGGAASATASADWPKGTRIVEESGKVYRVNADGTRVIIDDNSWRIVTEGDERYRVSADGTRVRIDDDGLDLDVDLGVNRKGNLDLDVSTDGTDAKN